MISKKMKRGFTLIELMATIALLGLILTIAVPTTTPFYRTYQLSHAKELLIHLIHRCRMRAIRDYGTTGIYFDVANEKATCYIESGANPGYQPAADESVQTINYKDSGRFKGGINIVSTTFTNNTVTFSGSGTASESGTVTLRAGNMTKSVTIYSGGAIE